MCGETEGGGYGLSWRGLHVCDTAGGVHLSCGEGGCLSGLRGKGGPGVYGIETPEGGCKDTTPRMQAWPLSQPGYERAWPPSLAPISSWDAGLTPIPTIHGLELYESVVSFVG